MEPGNSHHKLQLLWAPEGCLCRRTAKCLRQVRCQDLGAKTQHTNSLFADSSSTGFLCVPNAAAGFEDHKRITTTSVFILQMQITMECGLLFKNIQEQRVHATFSRLAREKGLLYTSITSPQHAQISITGTTLAFHLPVHNRI